MNEPRLKLEKSDGTAININYSPFSIGRAVNADYKLLDNRVSRIHAIFVRETSEWYVEDKSTNGTFLNGSLLNNRTRLKNGDVIKLGADNFEFKVEVMDDISDEVLIQAVEEVEHESRKRKSDYGLSSAKKKKTEVPEEFLEGCFDELTCSICSELFIKAVTLNCCHSFCSYCLENWKKSKKTCPICRKRIRNVHGSLVIDNVINKLMEKAREEVKEERKNIVQSRESAKKPKRVSKSATPPELVYSSILEISDDDYPSLGEEDDLQVFSLPSIWLAPSRPYYGGYGCCYVCGEEGHWANSCPMR